MRSRCRYTVPVLRILFFVFAFVLGISIAAWAKRLVLSEHDAAKLATAIEVAKPTDQNPDESSATSTHLDVLSVDYLCTRTGDEWDQTVYKLTNTGIEDIVFDVYIRDALGSDRVRTKLTEGTGLSVSEAASDIGTGQLKPGQTTQLRVPVPRVRFPIDISFKFGFTVARTRTVSVSAPYQIATEDCGDDVPQQIKLPISSSRSLLD